MTFVFSNLLAIYFIFKEDLMTFFLHFTTFTPLQNFLLGQMDEGGKLYGQNGLGAMAGSPLDAPLHIHVYVIIIF